MKIYKILEELVSEVSKVAYQGTDKLTVRVSLPTRAVQALSDELYAKDRSGTVRSVDIKSIHFNEGIVEIDTL